MSRRRRARRPTPAPKATSGTVERAWGQEPHHRTRSGKGPVGGLCPWPPALRPGTGELPMGGDLVWRPAPAAAARWRRLRAARGPRSPVRRARPSSPRRAPLRAGGQRPGEVSRRMWAPRRRGGGAWPGAYAGGHPPGGGPHQPARSTRHKPPGAWTFARASRRKARRWRPVRAHPGKGARSCGYHAGTRCLPPHLFKRNSLGKSSA